MKTPVLLLLAATALCAQGKLAPKPLYRDPVFDGAADPVVVWNRADRKWNMFYTNRRANAPGLSRVAWVHGTRIGVAESGDGGATWTYVGTAEINWGKPDYTHWAPEIVDYNGTYHMYLSIVPGIFEDWNAPRDIIHLTSPDLRQWKYESTLDLGSDRVIDPCVIRLRDGTWRMWYKNERAKDGSLYYADSTDLAHWTSKGTAIPGARGEGPKVFEWKGTYWLIADAWDGLSVYRSTDCLQWTRQAANILKEPGTIATDRAKGDHCDVVVSAGRAYIFYFTHQGGADAEGHDAEWQKHTFIQVAELQEKDGAIVCDRNQPVHIDLQPQFGPGPQQMTPRIGMKLGDFFVHDPFILPHRESQTYYLYNAGRGGVVVYKSKDLAKWDGPTSVFRVPEGTWANPAEGVWAPEVHFYNGKYYLLATLHNSQKPIEPLPPDDLIPLYLGEKAPPHWRGTQIFAADSPEGPFRAVSDGPAPPSKIMSLDGTLYVEDGVPYMVYAHEWIQVLDGTMEAVRLKPDLTASVGEPMHLFKASEAPWLKGQATAGLNPQRTFVTDGPWMYRTKTGKLLMLWSSYWEGKYVETLAYSTSGKLRGPWRQGEVLVGDDSGHGMTFQSFDGRLILVLHQPFRMAHGKLFELEDTGDTLRIKREVADR